MVFGWGKKKDVKEAQEPTSKFEKRILLSEINKTIKENEAQRIKKIVEQTKPIREQTDNERKKIIIVVSELERDDLKADEVDKHLKILIERGKKTVISGLRKETAINFSKAEKYSEILDLNSEIEQILKRSGDILGTNTRVMHVFARKYADRFKMHLANIATSKAKLQKLVDNHTKFESTVSEILDVSEKIKNSKKEIEEKNQRLLEIKNNLESLDRTTQTLESDINNLRSRPEYQEFLKIKKSIDSLAPEKEKIKYEIDLQFSKIYRPLGKYSYISSLEKPVKKIMEIMIENPSEAIIPENKHSIIEVLQAVVKGVVSGNVSVKDSQKAIAQIEETISMLDEFLKMKEAYSQKLVVLENKLGIFNIKSLEEKERTLQKVKTDKMQEETKTKTLENEINEGSKLIPRFIKEAEDKMGYIIEAKVSLIQD